MANPSVSIQCESCSTNYNFAVPNSVVRNPQKTMPFRCSVCGYRFNVDPKEILTQPSVAASYVLIDQAGSWQVHQDLAAVQDALEQGLISQDAYIKVFGEEWEIIHRSTHIQVSEEEPELLSVEEVIDDEPDAQDDEEMPSPDPYDDLSSEQQDWSALDPFSEEQKSEVFPDEKDAGNKDIDNETEITDPEVFDESVGDDELLDFMTADEIDEGKSSWNEEPVVSQDEEQRPEFIVDTTAEQEDLVASEENNEEFIFQEEEEISDEPELYSVEEEPELYSVEETPASVGDEPELYSVEEEPELYSVEETPASVGDEPELYFVEEEPELYSVEETPASVGDEPELYSVEEEPELYSVEETPASVGDELELYSVEEELTGSIQDDAALSEQVWAQFADEDSSEPTTDSSVADNESSRHRPQAFAVESEEEFQEQEFSALDTDIEESDDDRVSLRASENMENVGEVSFEGFGLEDDSGDDNQPIERLSFFDPEELEQQANRFEVNPVYVLFAIILIAIGTLAYAVKQKDAETVVKGLSTNSDRLVEATDSEAKGLQETTRMDGNGLEKGSGVEDDGSVEAELAKKKEQMGTFDRPAVLPDSEGEDLSIEKGETVDDITRRAWEAYNSGDADVAVRLFKIALAKEPQNFFAVSGLGAAYEMRGQNELAVSQYCQVASLPSVATDDLEFWLGHAEQLGSYCN